MAELQALLDEWIVAVWQNRPHDGLRDPLAPGRALTPNERYAALIEVAGYVPVPLGPRGLHRAAPGRLAGDQLLRRQDRPADLRQRRAEPLPPPALRHRARKTAGGRSVTTPTTSPGSGSATTTTAAGWPRPGHTCAPRRRRSASRPGTTPGEMLAARGSDPATEAEIAAAAADLLDRAGQGPGPGQAPPQQDQAAARTRSPRSRRVAGRTAATAAPQWPRPARPGDEDSAGPADARTGSRPRPRTRPRWRR